MPRSTRPMRWVQDDQQRYRTDNSIVLLNPLAVSKVRYVGGKLQAVRPLFPVYPSTRPPIRD
eukprot:COSAG01_NODE_5449_length_4258_cov_2.190430_2_plen_62_part_00